MLKNTKSQHTGFLFLESILFFLVLNPFFLLMLGTNFDSYDLQRITQLLLLLVLSIHLLASQPLRAHALQYLENFLSYRKLMLGVIVLLGIISALCATYSVYALMQVSTFLLLFIFVLIIAGLHACLQEKFVSWIINFILICFGISALTAIFLFLTRDPSAGLTLDANAFVNLITAPGYMNRRFFDDAVVFAIPLLTGFFFMTSNNWKRALIFCLISFLFARGILGGSRIYVYEPLSLLILLPVLFRKKAVPYLIVLALTLVCGYLLYQVMYHSIFNIQSVADGNFSFTDPNRRLLLWQLALDMIKNHPLLGVGPLHYPVYAFSVESYAAHPHDFILMLGSEWGIPATVLILLLAGFAYSSLIKKAFYHSTPRTLYPLKVKQYYNPADFFPMGLIGAITGALLMSLVDGLTLMPAGQIMLALTAGLALSWYRGKINPELQRLSSKRFNAGVLSLGLLAWIGIAFAVLPIVMLLPDISAVYLAKCEFACTLSPNYWSQGFIQFY